MSSNNPSIHHTITHKVQGAANEGWEFVCPICSYRARYITQAGHGSQQLEILHIGDPQVRHTSNHASVRLVGGRPLHIAENDGDEGWLTDELRKQMEDLLRDVDMGD